MISRGIRQVSGHRATGFPAPRVNRKLRSKHRQLIYTPVHTLFLSHTNIGSRADSSSHRRCLENIKSVLSGCSRDKTRVSRRFMDFNKNNRSFPAILTIITLTFLEYTFQTSIPFQRMPHTFGYNSRRRYEGGLCKDLCFGLRSFLSSYEGFKRLVIHIQTQ